MHEQARALVERLAIGGLDVADVTDVSGERRAGDPLEPGPASSVALPASSELGDSVRRASASDQPLVRVEQAADVLSRFERAEEQDVAAGRRRREARRGVQSGAPGGQIAMRSAGDAELPLALRSR